MTILNCSSIGLVGADGPSLQDAFPLLETFLAYYYPVGEKGSAFVNARRGTTFGYHNVGTPQFFLGGPRLLSAYGVYELFGNQYFLGSVGYLYKIYTLPPFVGKTVYLSASG